jgi:hypothetical protein
VALHEYDVVPPPQHIHRLLEASQGRWVSSCKGLIRPVQQHVGANPKQAIGVLSLVIDLDAVGVVFDHTYRQALVTQDWDDALEKGGLARILEAADCNHRWRRRPILHGAYPQNIEVYDAERVALGRAETV